MSYELYKHRDQTVRSYNRWLYTFVGKGEHEGTTHCISEIDLFKRRFDNERELAEVLDREFARAHAFRLANEHDAARSQSTPDILRSDD